MAELVHSCPKIHGGVRVVAAICHHEQADVVGFGLLLARGGHAEEDVEQGVCEREGEVKEQTDGERDEEEWRLGHFFAGGSFSGVYSVVGRKGKDMGQEAGMNSR